MAYLFVAVRIDRCFEMIENGVPHSRLTLCYPVREMDFFVCMCVHDTKSLVWGENRGWKHPKFLGTTFIVAIRYVFTYRKKRSHH